MTPAIRGSVMDNTQRGVGSSPTCFARGSSLEGRVQRNEGFEIPPTMDQLYSNTFVHILMAYKAQACESIECVSIWLELLARIGRHNKGRVVVSNNDKRRPEAYATLKRQQLCVPKQILFTCITH